MSALDWLLCVLIDAAVDRDNTNLNFLIDEKRGSVCVQHESRTHAQRRTHKSRYSEYDSGLDLEHANIPGGQLPPPPHHSL